VEADLAAPYRVAVARLTQPRLRSVVLDAPDARGLAEFYRRLLGYEYRPGDEPPPAGQPDPRAADWLILLDPEAGGRLAFQPVDELRRPTWPSPEIPQQLHLDLVVADAESLRAEHDRALSLGATLLADGFDDPEEPIYVYADPAGHPFCIFVAPAD
jgi:hypothetical protein